MTDLTKLQQALLTGACTRTDGSLLPAPDTLTVAPNRARKAAGQLIEMGLADERAVDDQSASWRNDGAALFGAFITDAGVQALPQAEEPDSTPAPVRQTKSQLLLNLLRRPDGVSVDEVIEATGWQAHSARAAITILKTKGGHVVERTGERGASRYRIAEAG